MAATILSPSSSGSSSLPSSLCVSGVSLAVFTSRIQGTLELLSEGIEASEIYIDSDPYFSFSFKKKFKDLLEPFKDTADKKAEIEKAVRAQVVEIAKQHGLATFSLPEPLPEHKESEMPISVASGSSSSSSSCKGTSLEASSCSGVSQEAIECFYSESQALKYWSRPRHGGICYHYPPPHRLIIWEREDITDIISRAVHFDKSSCEHFGVSSGNLVEKCNELGAHITNGAACGKFMFFFHSMTMQDIFYGRKFDTPALIVWTRRDEPAKRLRQSANCLEACMLGYALSPFGLMAMIDGYRGCGVQMFWQDTEAELIREHIKNLTRRDIAPSSPTFADKLDLTFFTSWQSGIGERGPTWGKLIVQGITKGLEANAKKAPAKKAASSSSSTPPGPLSKADAS